MNHRLLALLNPAEVTVVIRLAEEAEVEELWSYIKGKKEPRWLWHAIEPMRLSTSRVSVTRKRSSANI